MSFQSAFSLWVHATALKAHPGWCGTWRKKWGGEGGQRGLSSILKSWQEPKVYSAEPEYVNSEVNVTWLPGRHVPWRVRIGILLSILVLDFLLAFHLPTSYSQDCSLAPLPPPCAPGFLFWGSMVLYSILEYSEIECSLRVYAHGFLTFTWQSTALHEILQRSMA